MDLPARVHSSLLFSTAVLAVMSLVLMALGTRGLVSRRPFIFPSRVMFVFLVFAFLPNFVLPFGWSGPGRTHAVNFLALAPLLIFAVVLAMFWVQMKGYLIYGVSADSLMLCLRKTLAKLGLPYRESLASIRLESLDANLHAAVQDWVGTAQLRITPGKHAATLKDIAHGLQEEFVTEKVRAGSLLSVAHLLLGLILLALAISLGMPYR